MTSKKSENDIDFASLTPEQQEAYLPRGSYKNPAALDQGNAPQGAPTGPLAADDDSVGKPDPIVSEAGEPKPLHDDGEKPKTARKRTS